MPISTPAARGSLFLIALRRAGRTLARSTRPAVQLQLDAGLGRLRCADAGHGPGRRAVGVRGCIVEILPRGVVGGLFAELGEERFL